MSKQFIYKYKGQYLTRNQIYEVLGVPETRAYILLKKNKVGFTDLPYLISGHKDPERIEISSPPDKKINLGNNEMFIETYRGFNIIIKKKSGGYSTLEYMALCCVSPAVVRRCIDTYFNHLEMQENELSR